MKKTKIDANETLLIFDEIQYANALVRTPNLPLLSYAEREIFKLYCLDIGLLSARAALHESVLFELDNKIFSHFRGALTEQFILQELKAMENLPVYYYASERGSAEVDFVIQKNNEIIPIEVKASINLKAKSLKTYMEDFKPQTAIRTSLANFSKNETLIDIPLYAFAEVISATILNEGHFHLIDGDSFENIS